MATVTNPDRYLASVQIQLLGPITAVRNGDPVSLGGTRERALLALLALSAGRVVSTDRLIDDLWGEDLPAKPANALQALVSRLRKSIGAELIVTQPPGYVLNVDPDEVDASRFRSIVEAARRESDLETRLALYRRALGLWQGPPFAEFQFEEFAQRETGALEELRLAALEGRIKAELELGAGQDLVPELEALVEQHPLRESLRASQMLALYRAGRQADALRAYTAARETLGGELGIEPGPELRALEERILLQDSALSTSQPPASPLTNLPARVASFVGRDREIGEVVAAFAASRLVTLTGAGGAGKTSLAIETGRVLRDRYPDGVWLVELAPITEPALVVDTLINTLHLEHSARFGRSPADDVDAETLVVEHLRHKRSLIILDNCEHVLAGATHVAESILLQCPQTEVLATSRDRLGIPGELLWRVPPLGLGESQDAVSLFLDRARAVNMGFDPSPAELDLIARICERVDGMPLAIELAAARTRSLPIAEIARRLDTGIAVLSNRQQTLAETIEWSYELLPRDEQRLFTRLSVFHGTFSLPAAEAVAGGPVLDSLERLIDSSMITSIPAEGEMRYRMLETLRAYASERLIDAGETNEVMAGLLDFYTELLSGAEDGLRSADQLDWLDRIEMEHDTLRALLDWGTEQDPVPTLRLAAMLGWFWFLRGSTAEALERFGALLNAAGIDADARWRGDALLFQGLCSSRPEHSRKVFIEALQAYEAADHVEGVIHARAMVAAWGFDLEETLRLLDEAYTEAVALDYGWGMALARFLQAGAALGGRDNPAAVRLADEAIDQFEATGDRWGLGYGWYQKGTAHRALGEYDEATEALTEALDHARPMRLRREMAPVLCELGSIAVMQGDFQRAEQLFDDAERYADEMPFAGSQGMVRNARGRMARLGGDPDAALDMHQEAIAFYEESDTHGGLAWSHSCAGFAAEMRGNLELAFAHHRQALGYARKAGDVFAVAQGLEGIGASSIAAGDAVVGAELIHAGLAAREQAGSPLPAGERFDVDRALARASDTLSASDLGAAAERGSALDLDAAIELADS